MDEKTTKAYLKAWNDHDAEKSTYPDKSQPHSFNAVIFVWTGNNKNYGMRMAIENIDSCCEEHAMNSACNVAIAVKRRFENIWGQTFSYEVSEITQAW